MGSVVSRKEAGCIGGEEIYSARSYWLLAGTDGSAAAAALWTQGLQSHASLVHAQGNVLGGDINACLVTNPLTPRFPQFQIDIDLFRPIVLCMADISVSLWSLLHVDIRLAFLKIYTTQKCQKSKW